MSLPGRTALTPPQRIFHARDWAFTITATRGGASAPEPCCTAKIKGFAKGAAEKYLD
jgi:hypothetical protein